MKTKIITAVVNNPRFIEIQHYTIQKHFKGEYEFIVFNDAKGFPDFTNGNDIGVKSQIEETCRRLHIQCINIPNDGHRTLKCPVARCRDSMNYILDYQRKNPDRYLMLDSDMFLIDDFDIEAKYSAYECAIILQQRERSRTNYFWNGIYYFDMTRMKDLELLNWDHFADCDVGGRMSQWLEKQMAGKPMPDQNEIRWTNKRFHTDRIYFMKHLWSCTWDMTELPKNIDSDLVLVDFLKGDPRNVGGKFFCEIYDDVFLHYRAGGNWREEGLGFHQKLSESLYRAIVRKVEV